MHSGCICSQGPTGNKTIRASQSSPPGGQRDPCPCAENPQRMLSPKIFTVKLVSAGVGWVFGGTRWEEGVPMSDVDFKKE